MSIDPPDYAKDGLCGFQAYAEHLSLCTSPAPFTQRVGDSLDATLDIHLRIDCLALSIEEETQGLLHLGSGTDGQWSWHLGQVVILVDGSELEI